MSTVASQSRAKVTDPLMDRVLFWLFGSISDSSGGQSLRLKELTQIYRLTWFYISLFMATIFITIAITVTDFIQYTGLEMLTSKETSWMHKSLREWEGQPISPNLTRKLKMSDLTATVDPHKQNLEMMPDCLDISNRPNVTTSRRGCPSSLIGSMKYRTRFQVVLGIMLTERRILVRNLTERIDSFYWFECFTNCPKPYALQKPNHYPVDLCRAIYHIRVYIFLYVVSFFLTFAFVIYRFCSGFLFRRMKKMKETTQQRLGIFSKDLCKDERQESNARRAMDLKIFIELIVLTMMVFIGFLNSYHGIFLRNEHKEERNWTFCISMTRWPVMFLLVCNLASAAALIFIVDCIDVE